MKRTIQIVIVAALAAGCGSMMNAEMRRLSRTIGQNDFIAEPARVAVQLPPGHPPVSADVSPDQDDASLVVSGTIAETMNAGGYTYARVATHDGDVWTAVPEVQLKKGAPITVDGELVMENFESKTLKRTFEKIVFGTVHGMRAPLPHKPETATKYLDA